MQKRKKVKSLKTAWMFLMTAVLVLLVLSEITPSPAKLFIPIRLVIFLKLISKMNYIKKTNNKCALLEVCFSDRVIFREIHLSF